MGNAPQPSSSISNSSSVVTNANTSGKEAYSQLDLVAFCFLDFVLGKNKGQVQWMQKDGSIAPQVKTAFYRMMSDYYLERVNSPIEPHHKGLSGDLSTDIDAYSSLVKARYDKDDASHIENVLKRVLITLNKGEAPAFTVHLINGRPMFVPVAMKA